MKYAWLLTLALLSTQAQAGIGSVSELQGSALQVQHGKSVTPGALKSSIESNDVVITGSNTVTGIKFVDDTKVKITANSRLVIDDFVFDPKHSDAGKLALKVALGTVQYASGQIAKNNHQNVAIKTPTATIGVRGTDFAMTVDESGRSLVVLLPSCDDPKKAKTFDVLGNCVTGVIDVTNDSGVLVTLTKPFTATLVADAQAAPGAIIQLQPNIDIGNNLLVSKPEALNQWIEEHEEKKDEKRKPGSKTSDDDKKKVAKETTEKAQKDAAEAAAAETKLIAAAAGTKDIAAIGTNGCGVFDACGNEKGRNWYEKTDPIRGDYVRIRMGEKNDNTNYYVAQNTKDLGMMVIGPGSGWNTIIIRQTNQ